MKASIRHWLCFALAISAVVSSFAATSALADTHTFRFSFGSFTNPNGIAVDESSGDVYVADIGTDTVSKFDAAGKPVESWGTKGQIAGTPARAGKPAEAFAFPEVSGNPGAIAVDNSTNASDPSSGDLYVMDAGHSVIDKFSSSGAYLGQITGPFAGELLGLGIDASGDVRVDVASTGVGIDVFDNSQANAFVSFLNNQGRSTEFNMLLEHGFAAGPTGDDYLLFSCGCLEKLGGNLETLGRVDSTGADVAAAVDPQTGHVYVDDQSFVDEWDTGTMNGETFAQEANATGGETSSGALLSSFGSEQLSASSGQGGIAVSGASGEVYVSNPASHEVDVYTSDTPAVAPGAATNLTQTGATLRGSVDPRGATVTKCQFEYGPIGTYNQSVPCEQTPVQIGSGTSPVAVSADIGGLKAGRLYNFRLDVANAEGASSSSARFATAGPGFGVKTFEVSFLNRDGSPDVQAGSHPFEMVTNVAFNTTVLPRERTADSIYVTQPDGNLKDVIVDTPPGLVGDPDATAAKCTLGQLEAAQGNTSGVNHCPAESKIGELEVEFGDDQLPSGRSLGFSRLNLPVYNMVPPHGVAVQFGANFIIPKAFIDAGVLAGGDYPVQATVLESPVIEPVIVTRLTVFGVVGHGENRKAFLTLPTGCTGPLRSTISTDSYQDPGHFVGATTVTRDVAGQPVALSGCSQLLFPPTITVSPDVADASSSTGLTVGVHVSQKAALNPDGLAESALRDTTVTLPEGVAINPAGADGLQACSEGLAGFTGFAEFNSEFEPGVKTATFTPQMPEPLQPGTNFCPDGSKIGTVAIHTPLLSHPLEGAVYLAAQNANPFGSLVAMYMIAEDPVSGSLIKLAGEVSLSETGQIVTTFKNTPDLPFEDLELHFFGGERAPLTTPSRCGTYTTNALFTPWDGNGAVPSSSSFSITSGPNGSPCPGASLPFEPSLTAGTTNVQAGALTPFTMTMSREDGNQSLQAISLRMPPGLSGLLTNVKLCKEAQANAGTCGPESEIGETVVSVGVGGHPFSVTGGKVYITGAYEGAPFGLSIVNPAKAGPYDLGQVVVRAKIEVNPITAALTITSDNAGAHRIPQYIDGIPLEIRHVNVTIDRPKFTFNPTNCSKMQLVGDLSSSEGAAREVSVPFQVTNCAALGFKPQFKVSTSGKTSRARGASLRVKLSYPKAPFGSQANIRSVKVSLPRQLPSRLTTLQKACPDRTFEQNPAACQPASRVGTATATTPLLPVPLNGPAYFVSHGGAKFPELIIVLSGYGVTVDLHGETFINEKTRITSSIFRTVPDVPVGTFELKLPQGSSSALAANGNLCRSKLAMPTAFTAQNGAVIHRNTKIGVTSCPKAHHRKVRHRKKKR
jgi:hypothetical protein